MFSTRVNYPIIAASINRSFITAILGPRRVGKTSLVAHYQQQHPEHLWVSFTMDNLVQKAQIEAFQLKSMITEAAKQHIGEGKKIWVILDEAQKCPALFDQIKILYDAFKQQDALKFIITGSAALSLHQLSAETLAGRIELYYLHAFTLQEITAFYEPNFFIQSVFDALDQDSISNVQQVIHALAPYKGILEDALNHQLIWGGFPELLTLNQPQEKLIYLNNYLQTYLEKDVRAITSITDLNLYRHLMDITAEQTGSLRDDTRMVQALGCTRDTLKKYRGYLSATLLFLDVYPYINTSLKRLVKSPKGYLLNNGLISVLTGLMDFSILQKTGLIGHRLENWFLSELLVWLARSPMRNEIQFWRTTSGVEVDFVIVKKPYVFPFEVTYQTLVEPNKIRKLEKFLKEEPKANWGYYVYRGEFKMDEAKKIIFLPCWSIG